MDGKGKGDEGMIRIHILFIYSYTGSPSGTPVLLVLCIKETVPSRPDENLCRGQGNKIQNAHTTRIMIHVGFRLGDNYYSCTAVPKA